LVLGSVQTIEKSFTCSFKELSTSSTDTCGEEKHQIEFNSDLFGNNTLTKTKQCTMANLG
jgi:hypothetical protein